MALDLSELDPCPFKVQFFFTLGSMGFSEILWLESASKSAALATTVTLAEARVKVSPPDVILKYARYGQPIEKGRTSVKHFNMPGEYSLNEQDITHADIGYVLRCESADGRRKISHIRGIPEEQVFNGTADVDLLTDFPDLDAYATLLKTATVMVVNTAPGDPTALIKVITVTQLAKVGRRKAGRPVF